MQADRLTLARLLVTVRFANVPRMVLKTVVKVDESGSS
jgi:hypothetical protein